MFTKFVRKIVVAKTNLGNWELSGIAEEAAATVHEERGESGAEPAFHCKHPRYVRYLKHHQHLLATTL